MKNYKEITNEIIKQSGWDKVKETVPFAYEVLKEESMKDKNLSTIKFNLWECSTGFIECNGELIQVNSKFRILLKDNGILDYSIHDAVCILKEIAEQIVEKGDASNATA